MSDYQPPQPPYAPQPDQYPPAQPPQYAPPAPPQYPPAQPVTPQPKKKTGLIIAIVVIVVLLLCCCGAGAVGYFFYAADQGSSSSTSTDSSALETDEPDPDEEARLAEWQKVQDAFVAGERQYVDPDERARRLAQEAVDQLLPDFQIEELMVEHGEYNEEEGWHYWDSYVMRLSLKDDPEVQTAYGIWVHTADGDARNTAREDLTLEDDEDVFMLEGKTWVIYRKTTKGPLLHGIQDPAYVNLMKQAMDDFPDGLPTTFKVADDGSTVTVQVETWDSYGWSDTFDRIDADYEQQDDGWLLLDYTGVIEEKESDTTGA